MLISSHIDLFVNAPQTAIAAFHAEAGQGNTGYESTCRALRQYFSHPESAAHARAAAFLPGSPADQQRLRSDLVTTAQFLLGE